MKVDSSINGISRNLEETGVVFAARAADGIKFPKRRRDRVRDIVRSENLIVPISQRRIVGISEMFVERNMHLFG